jgi:hypothetical protein
MAFAKKEKKEPTCNIISNPADRASFKQVLVTITHYMQIMDDQREGIKDTIAEAKATYGIDPKHIRKLAKTMFKQNFADVHEENEHFEFLYEAIVGGRLVTTDPLDDEEDSE